MQNRRKLYAAMCAVCVVLACDGPRRDPVAPSLISTSVSPAMALSELASTGGPKVSGHADIHGTPAQGIGHETYSFIALPTDVLPLANGRVEAHFVRILTGERVTVHAEVTCASIVGNRAWVGGRVTRFLVEGKDEPVFVGGPITFRVQDMGEGKGATDLASLLFFGVPSGGVLSYCSRRPEGNILRESESGNIQVQP